MSIRVIIVACALVLLSSIPGGSSSVSVAAEPLACAGAYCSYLPLVKDPMGKYFFPIINNNPPIVEQALIINHNNIDITKIPVYWLAQARTLAIHYAHTSHGGQILEGMGYMETYMDSSKFAFATSYGSPPTLAGGTNILKIYDGNNYGGDSYIYPWMYWSDEGHGLDGVNHTNSTANTGIFDYSMWSWCGQAETSNVSYIDEYLAQMSSFEAAHPDMRFILMTGHNVTNPGTNLLARNQQIRDYALANDMVLFDFADIETHAPDGTFYDPVSWNYSDGDCYWCDDWCASHASDCSSLPSDCSHVDQPYGGLICKMKAQAFWWMMARLAGWDGPPEP